MKTLRQIEEELLEAATLELMANGFGEYLEDPPDNVNLTLTIKGYSKTYDGFSPNLQDSDWANIMSIDWDNTEKGLLEEINSTGNSVLKGPKLKELEVHQYTIERINNKLARNHGKYVLASFVRVGRDTRRFHKDGRVRMFIRP